VRKLVEENLKPFFSKFDCHKWRRETLWNEKSDLVYKRNMSTFDKIYKKNSGRYALPGATKFMSLDEFYGLITTCGVVDDNFGQREVSIMFNLSMMTQRDEGNNDRHTNMILAEFIESIGRIADKLILPPLVDESEELDVKEGLKNSIKRRSGQKYPDLHLSYKIETLIFLMAMS
jgi:hypothetical protein